MKQYIKPEQEIVESKAQSILTGSIPVSTQGGADPGHALTKAFSGLMDIEPEDEEEL